MKMFPRDDLRLFVLRSNNGLRYLIGEFIDEYDEWCMGFFRFSRDGHVLMNIPVGMVPSEDLCEWMWKVLKTSERPTLTVSGGGYFSGDEYFTYESALRDDTIIQGQLIEEIYASDGKSYSLVMSQCGCERFAFIGCYAGSDKIDTPEECHFWWPTPVPPVLSDEINQLFGIADMFSADFLEYPDGIH